MSVLIVITRLRLSGPQHRRAFLTAAASAITQATHAPGNLGTGVFPDDHDVYWTRTAWSDRESLAAFVGAQPHLGMMGSIDEWCDEATFVEWEQETPELPGWPAAHARLVEGGRANALSRPSPDHEARSFPPPRLG